LSADPADPELADDSDLVAPIDTADAFSSSDADADIPAGFAAFDDSRCQATGWLLCCSWRIKVLVVKS
jgi:hypothetical protein